MEDLHHHHHHHQQQQNNNTNNKFLRQRLFFSLEWKPNFTHQYGIGGKQQVSCTKSLLVFQKGDEIFELAVPRCRVLTRAVTGRWSRKVSIVHYKLEGLRSCTHQSLRQQTGAPTTFLTAHILNKIFYTNLIYLQHESVETWFLKSVWWCKKWDQLLISTRRLHTTVLSLDVLNVVLMVAGCRAETCSANLIIILKFSCEQLTGHYFHIISIYNRMYKPMSIIVLGKKQIWTRLIEWTH